MRSAIVKDVQCLPVVGVNRNNVEGDGAAGAFENEIVKLLWDDIPAHRYYVG